MKAARTNLHLHLSFPSWKSKADKTNLDNASSDSASRLSPMGPITPVGQKVFTPVYEKGFATPMTPSEEELPEDDDDGLSFRDLSRVPSQPSSIGSSIASSIDGMDYGYVPPFTFSSDFDQLLMNTYQECISNPQVTPFSGRFPPSGIVGKVAKQALKKARKQGVRIEHSYDPVINVSGYNATMMLTLIRKRILELCQQDEPVSPAAATPLFRPGFQAHRSRANSSDSVRGVRNRTPQLADQPAVPAQQTPPPPLFSGQRKTSWLHLGSLPACTRSETGNSSSGLANLSRFSSADSLIEGLGPVKTSGKPAAIPTPPEDTVELASPFDVSSTSNTTNEVMASRLRKVSISDKDDYETLFNVTSERKRESLRLKRNGGLT